MQRYLDRRPILARPVGDVEKLALVPANPASSALLAGIAAILVMAFGLISWSYVRADHARKNEANQRRLADDARDIAERNEQAGASGALPRNIAAASAALQLQKSDTARRALDAAPEQHRNWEWQLFHNQLDGASRILAIGDRASDHYGWPVFGMSPDGRQLATANKNLTVNLWDANSTASEPVHVLRGHAEPVRDVAYRSDGRQTRDRLPRFGPPLGSGDGTAIVRAADGRNPGFGLQF